MSNLSDILKQEAVDLGLCKPWTEAWGNCSQQELIDKYKKGIDFCIDKQYPSNEFIKANFDRALLNENLIFVDEHINLETAPSGIYVINGECTGRIWFGKWAAATIFVRHNSKIRIEADRYAKVFVRLYDNAEVECDYDESAVVKVYDRR